MNRNPFLAAILLLIFFAACNGSADAPSNSITGKWTFRQRIVQNFAYPSVLAGNNFIVSISNYSVAYDSISLNLRSNGTYTFTNLHVPIDEGTYTIAQDSFLIIHPDSAGLIRFCYPDYGSILFSTSLPNQPAPPATSPYAGFHFVSDTFLYKKPAADSLVFTTYWINKTSTPIIPSGDTLLFNQATTYFIKK